MLIFIHFLIGLLSSAFIVIQLSKRRALPSLWLWSMTILFMSVFPIFFLNGWIHEQRQFSHLTVDEYKHFFNISSAVTFIFFIIFSGFYILSYKKFPIRLFAFSRFKSDKNVAIAFVLIGLLALFLFIQSYGGLGYVLMNISSIRSGTAEVKSYFGSTAKLFSVYIDFSLFLLFLMHLDKKWHRESLRWVRISFYCVMTLVLFRAFLAGSRGGVIFIFISLYFCYIFYVGRFVLKKEMIFLFLFAVFFIVYGKSYVFQILRNPDSEFKLVSSLMPVISEVVSEYHYVYLSLVNALVEDCLGCRFFGDFTYWAFKPLHFFGVEYPDSVSYFNTFLANGQWTSDIPPGVLAFSVMQGGVAVIPVAAGVLGTFMGAMDKVFVNSWRKFSKIDIVIWMYFSLNVTSVFFNSDLALIIQTNLPFIVLLLVLILARRVRFFKF